jgi:hypothetical protein
VATRVLENPRHQQTRWVGADLFEMKEVAGGKFPACLWLDNHQLARVRATIGAGGRFLETPRAGRGSQEETMIIRK